jgi:hypothetical protein
MADTRLVEVKKGNGFHQCEYIYGNGQRCGLYSMWEVDRRQYCTSHARVTVFPKVDLRSKKQKRRDAANANA